MILLGFQWWGPVPNRTAGAAPNPPLGLILHVIVGTLAGADSVFKNPSKKASSHFGAGKKGERVQWVDTADRAWTQGAGNSQYHSVETEGQPSEALTDAQVETVAVIYAWGHRTHGWPFQLANAPGERGLGTHSMGGAAWGGHACPGAIRAGQRQRIIDRARQIANSKEDDLTPEQDQRLKNAETNSELAKVHAKNAADAASRAEDAVVNTLTEQRLVNLEAKVDKIVAKLGA